MIGARAATAMSGLDYLRAIRRGELPEPPIMSLLNFEIGEIEEGRVTFKFTPAEYHYNPIGSVHGGVMSTVCDSAMGCAVHTTLEATVGYTTLELKVNFLRPLTRDTGEVVCEGKIIHAGGRIATAESRITDASGAIYAHATATCLIVRPKTIGQ
jgi:uncharacterized protein (TIGR00369 family)